MLRKLYLSPLGVVIAVALNLLGALRRPFMVYGYFDLARRTFRKNTRISSSAVLESKDRIRLGDNVWIGHGCVLDGSGGLDVGDGVHMAAGVSIFTHGSHIAIRLYGPEYIKVPFDQRVGYVLEPVKIGEYSFLGTRAIVLPGVTVGRGCMVAAGSVVTRSAPDFAILRGSPARVVGDTRDLDRPFFEVEGVASTYFDQGVIDHWRAVRSASAS